jgi:RNA polymerase sigma-70 factor, ECF subfamily
VNDEAQLIRSALDGDSSSFGVLVERYQNRLIHCILSVISDVEEAEDVVQESFVQAYIKLDTFQQNSQFFTWLYRIAFNNALSRRRRRKGGTSLDQAREVGGLEPSARVAAPDHHLLQSENIQQVRDALARLTDDHRIILNLREMEDMAYEDIATTLDISIGTVRSRLSRARNALKEQLERDGDWGDA